MAGHGQGDPKSHILQAVGFVRLESCSTQAVLPLVGLAADQVTRDRYNETTEVFGLPGRAGSHSQLSFAAENLTRVKVMPSWSRVLAIALVFIAAGLAALPVMAQQTHHYFHRADMAPGAIGRGQLMRGGPLPGHFQAVEVTAPKGAQLALAMDGTFEPSRSGPLKAGMLVGHVYRLKVTDIPLHEGEEVFPSIEVINRLYPPPGAEAAFSIPVQLTQEELERALRGQFVIRVIYLEDPRAALPSPEDPEQQRYFEVGPGEDPLEVADSLGRPMAILRIGSRVPERDQVSGRFLFRAPPWFRIPEVTGGEPAPSPARANAGNAAANRTSRPVSPPTAAQRPRSKAGVNR
ncbi:MAG: hypothetical protein ACQESR_28735 [Planctomycetota bacterium]